MKPDKFKLTENGVEYESSCDRAQYLISELTRAALKDVGKLVMRYVSKALKTDPTYGNLFKAARYMPKRYQYWVRTKEQYLDVGIENESKGAVSAWWADQWELGTNGQPKRGILTAAVKDHLDEIREVEAHYLSAVEDEIAADGMIDETEENGEAGEDE